MTKIPRLSRSGIEYLDYVWNFYSGCHHKEMGICSVDSCWAKNIVNRFGNHYPNGFEPTFYPEALCSPLHLKKASIIGCAFMGDLFGDWVDPHTKMEAMLPSGVGSIGMTLKGWMFTTIKQCPQHKFLFLTKNPRGLARWGDFPENCWVGVTATDGDMFYNALAWLMPIDAKVKYISIEPLLDWPESETHFARLALKSLGKFDVNWLIIGSQTKPYKPPKIEWAQEIVEAADKAGIPIFEKNNLAPMKRKEMLSDFAYLRQEFPKC